MHGVTGAPERRGYLLPGETAKPEPGNQDDLHALTLRERPVASIAVPSMEDGKGSGMGESTRRGGSAPTACRQESLAPPPRWLHS